MAKSTFIWLPLFSFVHVRFEEGYGLFHYFGGLQNEGQEDFSFSEQIADVTHGRNQNIVNNIERLITLEKNGEDIIEAVFGSFQYHSAECFFRSDICLLLYVLFLFALIFEIIDKCHKRRFVRLVCSIIDQVMADIAVGLIDLGERNYFGSVDNRRVESSFYRFGAGIRS